MHKLPSILAIRINTKAPHGCWLWLGAKVFGYGYGYYVNKTWRIHRLVWTLLRGPIPVGKHVLHDCPGGDNRACCNPDHLWLGNHKQNMADMVAKGRSARGDRHSSKTHPERVARGIRNGRYTHPETTARGDRNGARMYPERLARGDKHHFRLHPELIPRGSRHGKSKITERDVRAIRKRYRTTNDTMGTIARDYPITEQMVRNIISRKFWKHVL